MSDAGADFGDQRSDDDGEAARIRAALRRAGGNVVTAARMLGLGRNAPRYRMRRLGIAKPSLDELLHQPADAPADAPPPRAVPPSADGNLGG